MRSHGALPETEAGWNLASRPQPRGDTQINGDGLVQDIKASYKYA